MLIFVITKDDVKYLLPFSVILIAALPAAGQVSFSLNVGTVSAAEPDDPLSLQNTWVPTAGNSSQTESMVFYSKGSGTSVKFSAMYEVSEIFSAGLTYRIEKWSMEENFRTSDINSFGGLFPMT